MYFLLGEGDIYIHIYICIYITCSCSLLISVFADNAMVQKFSFTNNLTTKLIMNYISSGSIFSNKVYFTGKFIILLCTFSIKKFIIWIFRKIAFLTGTLFVIGTFTPVEDHGDLTTS